MGLFSFLKPKTFDFTPNFRKTEHENWLDFVECGGSSKEWQRLKEENGWRFRESAEEKWEKYQNEVKEVADRYYEQMQEIQNDWSVIYNLGDYNGNIAVILEKKCLSNIADYKEMQRIDRKYKRKTATNVPAFRRLAMLYEKQGKFEEAIKVCMQACSLGMDERSRMVRMIKKSGRIATAAELKLLGEE